LVFIRMCADQAKKLPQIYEQQNKGDKNEKNNCN